MEPRQLKAGGIQHFDTLTLTVQNKNRKFQECVCVCVGCVCVCVCVCAHSRVPGSIELCLPDMVRGAKSSSQCSIKMAKDRATPRFSLFRSKRIKGWWPLVKPKSQEDIEREKKEEAEAMKKGGKKKKSKRSKMNVDDLEFTESGVTYLLMVCDEQFICLSFTFSHLADTLIQSNLQ